MYNSIKFNGVDMNLNISLGSTQDFYGYQQEIDSAVVTTGQELINPIVDGEIVRYKQIDGLNTTLNFYFYNTTNGLHYNDFTSIGFSVKEISSHDTVALNSFFILDCYDSFDPNTQTKLFTTYLTKIGDSPKYTFDSINTNSIKNQFFYLNIPQSFIDKISPSEMYVNVYVKFSFYNAKTGNIHIFYNKENELFSTPDKMYIKYRFNVYDKNWKFSTTNSTVINAYELNPNSEYSKRVNNTVKSTTDKQQVYPTGNAFNQGTGTYITL